MTPLRQRYTHDLQLRNYAKRTISVYVASVADFARHAKCSPEHLGAADVRRYQLHLLQRRVSWSRFNQAVCALRFLYRVTLQRPDVVTMIPYGKKPKSLPAVLSPDEVRRLFDVITQPRLLLIVQLAYGAGLRVSEVVRLQVGDIDAARMVLHIRCAKGNKDRLVPLPPVLLDSLRQHWRQHRPETWLFAGQSRGTHLCIAQVQRLFGQALRAAGITKKAGMHTLRHSYATHLLEAGTDLASLQKLLGHNHLSTTMRYIHLRQVPLQRTVSPLDTLPAAQAVEEVLWDSPPWMSEPSCVPPGGSTPPAS